MLLLPLILLIFAMVLFLISALMNPPEHAWRNRLVCLGLACWVGAEIVVRAVK